MRFFAALVLLFTSIGFSALAQKAEAPWEEVNDGDGIKSWKQELPGDGVPGFRGQTVIEAPIEAIRVVLEDIDHHTEWMHNCVEARAVKRISPEHRIVYNQTGAPWPVWNRDVVLETVFAWSEGGKVLTLSFENTQPELVPLPKKTVRMPRLAGYYRLVQLSPTKTQVTYQVVADVGGSIPRWLAERVAKDMPHKTLSALRERVKRTAGK